MGSQEYHFGTTFRCTKTSFPLDRSTRPPGTSAPPQEPSSTAMADSTCSWDDLPTASPDPQRPQQHATPDGSRLGRSRHHVHGQALGRRLDEREVALIRDLVEPLAVLAREGGCPCNCGPGRAPCRTVELRQHHVANPVSAGSPAQRLFRPRPTVPPAAAGGPEVRRGTRPVTASRRDRAGDKCLPGQSDPAPRINFSRNVSA